MGIETASFISELDAANPTSSDIKGLGDNHLRLIKFSLKNQFPNFTAAQVLASVAELNYLVGVTSSIQTQLNAKAGLFSPAFTGVPTAPTATAGDSTFQIANTAFVTATAFSSVLPGQAGNAGKFITTDGTNASWANPLNGTAAGAINWAATVTVASAATTDIGAAASNSINVTGTTTITALGTIAAGATRKVRFAGVLMLTHNATSLILPGGISLVTAAGDVAQFTSLGGGNWNCDYYTRAAGPVGNHEVTVHTGNGYGSTNTAIRRYTTTLTSAGTAITYADSATLGASFTINEAGLYEVFMSDATSSSGYFGASLNAPNLTVSSESVAIANRIFAVWAPSGTRAFSATRTLRLAQGDVVRPQNGGMDVTNNLAYFSIRKVGS